MARPTTTIVAIGARPPTLNRARRQAQDIAGCTETSPGRLRLGEKGKDHAPLSSSVSSSSSSDAVSSFFFENEQGGGLSQSLLLASELTFERTDPPGHGSRGAPFADQREPPLLQLSQAEPVALQEHSQLLSGQLRSS